VTVGRAYNFVSNFDLDSFRPYKNATCDHAYNFHHKTLIGRVRTATVKVLTSNHGNFIGTATVRVPTIIIINNNNTPFYCSPS